MKEFKKHYFASLILITIVLAIFISIPNTAQASILPSCTSTGRCTICDLVQTAINIGQYVLGFIGSITLLMFVYGGVVMLTSAGNPSKVQEGKSILINAVIGLLIAFLAYTVVTFVVSAVTGGNWDWQNKLNCAPLPEQIHYTPPDRSSDTGGSVAEGGSCTKTDECNTGLYCTKHTKVCATKLPTTNDQAGQCAGMEISGNDNLACQSGDCITMIDPAAIIPGGCQVGQCCHSGGVQEENTTCTAQNCGSGLYCQVTSHGSTTGKCVPKNAIGIFCNGDSVLGGSANEMCTSNVCNKEKCVYPPGVAKVGEFCNHALQCSTYSCACNGYESASGIGPDCSNDGKCIEKQLKDAWCDDWAVGSASDDTICKTTPDGCDTCQIGTSNCGKCR